MYKDRQPKDWVNQFQIAGQQGYENHLENQTGLMDTQESQ